MAIKYLDAKRLQGTNAERLALTTNTQSSFSPIIWTNKTHYTATDATGALIKSTNDGAWSQVCKSTASTTITSGLSVSLKFVSTADHHIGTGLSWYDGSGGNGSSALDQQVVSFGVYSTTTTAGNVIIDGTPSTGYGSAGDEWEILLSPTSCKWYVEGVLVHTHSTVPVDNGAYYGVCTAYNTSDGLTSSSLATTVVSQPSLPNGTIFNETDTYKYFMFDGTDTWNQMVSS